MNSKGNNFIVTMCVYINIHIYIYMFPFLKQLIISNYMCFRGEPKKKTTTVSSLLQVDPAKQLDAAQGADQFNNFRDDIETDALGRKWYC